MRLFRRPVVFLPTPRRLPEPSIDGLIAELGAEHADRVTSCAARLIRWAPGGHDARDAAVVAERVPIGMVATHVVLTDRAAGEIRAAVRECRPARWS